jgi:signal transduction histidine kinase
MKGAYETIEKAPTEGAEIMISDNGHGITQEIFEKIFDPFFTTKNTSTGSGFGLYNCKIFMEDHKGKISFQSKLNKGTTFFLFLPLSQQ